MNREFDFIDLYYLNDVEDTIKHTSEISLADDIAAMRPPRDVIEISDTSDISMTYTYAKFFEIMDTQGLEGLVNL